MSKYLVIDFETSIQYKEVLVNNKLKRVPDTHWASWKDPRNDFYTIIYGTSPNRIKLLHSKKGFKRSLPYRISTLLKDVPMIIGTNLKFDLGYIWKDPNFQQWLKDGGEIWDIQVARYLLSGQRHQYPSLAEMQRLYLGMQTKSDAISSLFKRCIGADEIIRRRYERKLWWKLYQYYCYQDGSSPMLIMQCQYKLAKAMGMLPIIKLYNQYLLALCMIETNGLHIDIETTEQRYQEFSLKAVDYLRQATTVAKQFWTDDRLPEFNVQSRDHSSAILFGGKIKVHVSRGTGVIIKTGVRKGQEKTKKIKEEVVVKGFGLPLSHTEETKKKGVYRTGEEIINHIYANSKNEQAKNYCKLLKLSSTYKQKISTYLDAFLYKSVDGLVYPNFNNTETITSRLSASSPNVQNMPKHGEFYKLIQGLIVAPKGWTCCQIDFCLAPGTRVLTEEFIWECIENIKEGQTLIGFDENKSIHSGNRWQPSIVEKTKRLIKDCYKIITDEGEIVCSEDHMFLLGNHNRQTNLKWIAAKDIKLHHTFSKVMEVWDTPENHETGWGAGFLDGEGYLSNSSQIGFGQNADSHNKLCFEKMTYLFDKYLVNSENRYCDKKRCVKVRPAGLRTGWQAVGIFQPLRLKAKLKEQYTNTQIRSRLNRKVKIKSIEFIGKHEVIALQTSTKTFLAEGFLSHNCQLETYCRALLTREETLTNDLMLGVDFHVQNMAWGWGITYDEGIQLSKIDKIPEWVERRASAKAVTFGEAYGQMPESMAVRTGWDKEIIEKIYANMYNNYPGLVEFDKLVNREVHQSAVICRKSDLPYKMTTGNVGKQGMRRRFNGDMELLPIRMRDKKTYIFKSEYPRHVGYYQSLTGKLYSFEEYGSLTKTDEVFVYFKPTQLKNYSMQGTASDIQAMTTVAMFKLLLKHPDKVKIINEIHDSKWFIIKNEYVDCIVPKLCAIMCNVKQYLQERFNVIIDFDFTAEAEVGPNFADLKAFDTKVQGASGKC